MRRADTVALLASTHFTRKGYYINDKERIEQGIKRPSGDVDLYILFSLYYIHCKN